MATDHLIHKIHKNKIHSYYVATIMSSLPGLFQGLTSGEFEKNLHSLNLKEGKDYFHFN